MLVLAPLLSRSMGLNSRHSTSSFRVGSNDGGKLGCTRHRLSDEDSRGQRSLHMIVTTLGTQYLTSYTPDRPASSSLRDFPRLDEQLK